MVPEAVDVRGAGPGPWGKAPAPITSAVAAQVVEAMDLDLLVGRVEDQVNREVQGFKDQAGHRSAKVEAAVLGAKQSV